MKIDHVKKFLELHLSGKNAALDIDKYGSYVCLFTDNLKRGQGDGTTPQPWCGNKRMASTSNGKIMVHP